MRRRDKVEQKQRDAAEREAAWRELSYEEQLRILKRRPGHSRRQVQRIRKAMESRNVKA